MTDLSLPHGWLRFSSGPLIMGVVNANADSFSDPRSGDSLDPVIEHATELVHAGADVLDIGGQTASPAVPEVGIDEELSRVMPVIDALSSALPHVPLSIDTYRVEVAEAALQAGASILNASHTRAAGPWRPFSVGGRQKREREVAREIWTGAMSG